MKTYIDERITCKLCRSALAQCPTNEHGYPLAAEVFKVGNQAKPSLGCAMYFAEGGKVALCVADKREA